MSRGLPGQRRAAVLLLPEVCVCGFFFVLLFRPASLLLCITFIAPLKLAHFTTCCVICSFIEDVPLSYSVSLEAPSTAVEAFVFSGINRWATTLRQ